MTGRYLFSLGANVNALNNEGLTPLHLAVKALNIRFAKDLLLRGANRDQETVEGKKPIEMVPVGDDVMKQKFMDVFVSLHITHSTHHYL